MMFKPSQLGKIVAEGVIAYGKEDRTRLLYFLKEFEKIWSSKECRNYITNFGKAAGILQNKGHKFAEMFNTDWHVFLDCGTYLSTIAVTEDYNPMELLLHFSKINRTIGFLQEHEKKIDEVFAKGFDNI